MSNHRNNHNSVPASAVMFELGALTTVGWAGTSPSGMFDTKRNLFGPTQAYHPGKLSTEISENPRRRQACTTKSRSSSSLEGRQLAAKGKRFPSKQRNEIFSASALN
jgi:hypothetical protein